MEGKTRDELCKEMKKVEELQNQLDDYVLGAITPDFNRYSQMENVQDTKESPREHILNDASSFHNTASKPSPFNDVVIESTRCSLVESEAKLECRECGKELGV